MSEKANVTWLETPQLAPFLLQNTLAASDENEIQQTSAGKAEGSGKYDCYGS